MAELSKFDPSEKLQQTMTNDRLTLLLNRIHKSNPNAVLFKSIEGMSIDSVESRNLTVTSIANEVAIGCQDKDEQVATLLKNLCFSEKNVQLLRDVQETNQTLKNGSNIEKEDLQLQSTMNIIPR